MPAMMQPNVTFPQVAVINKGAGDTVAGWWQDNAGTCFEICLLLSTHSLHHTRHHTRVPSPSWQAAGWGAKLHAAACDKDQPCMIVIHPQVSCGLTCATCCCRCRHAPGGAHLYQLNQGGADEDHQHHQRGHVCGPLLLRLRPLGLVRIPYLLPAPFQEYNVVPVHYIPQPFLVPYAVSLIAVCC